MRRFKKDDIVEISYGKEIGIVLGYFHTEPILKSTKEELEKHGLIIHKNAILVEYLHPKDCEVYYGFPGLGQGAFGIFEPHDLKLLQRGVS